MTSDNTVKEYYTKNLNTLNITHSVIPNLHAVIFSMYKESEWGQMLWRLQKGAEGIIKETLK